MTAISSQHSLKSFNTFGLAVNAKSVMTFTDVETLKEQFNHLDESSERYLILGEGSNTLFIEDFDGSVFINRISSIHITEKEHHWELHVGAGVKWHELVKFTLEHRIPGLENLALIPGCVGSAPIQNIGAYGVEQQQFCSYVDTYNTDNHTIERMPNEQCQFSYRNSIFKHTYKNRVVTAVGYRLPKIWTPIINYGALTELTPSNVTPELIFNVVCQTRQEKLPDPSVLGNAGSFFQNPLVSKQLSDELLAIYPNMPHYLQNNGEVKLAAGWLIDQCGLKGYQIGGAAVHSKQALVLINKDNAIPSDIVKLARHIYTTVYNRFSVSLEPEVRFISAKGEINSSDYIRIK